MSSMASSTTFFAPIHDFTRARRTPTTTLPPLPFIKSSFASSKSTFYHPALSLQPSSNFPRLFTKPKTFSVHARAATEKTIYDFPVKVPCWISISITLFLENKWVSLGIWIGGVVFLKFAFFYHDNLLLWTVLPNGETLNLEKKVYYFYLLCAQGVYYIIWCRILTERMFLLASLRGRFYWLSMMLHNGMNYAFFKGDMYLSMCHGALFSLNFPIFNVKNENQISCNLKFEWNISISC